jgi:hypothetical protein
MVDIFIDAKEAAERIGTNVNHLRQLQFRKQLQWAEKRGRQVFYRLAEIERYLESRKK